MRLWIAYAGCNHAGRRSSPTAAKNAQAGAAIENKLCAIRRSEFEARSVSAIAPGRGVHGRRGAAHSPEAQFGDRTAHRLFKAPEAVHPNRHAAFRIRSGRVGFTKFALRTSSRKCTLILSAARES